MTPKQFNSLKVGDRVKINKKILDPRKLGSDLTIEAGETGVVVKKNSFGYCFLLVKLDTLDTPVLIMRSEAEINP